MRRATVYADPSFCVEFFFHDSQSLQTIRQHGDRGSEDVVTDPLQW